MNIICILLCVSVEYYFVILGYQTVGEEYVNIIQIDTYRRNIPSKLVGDK